MSTTPYSEKTEVYVGDTGPIMEALITEADGYTVRDLTGYAATVRFWSPVATEAHIVRACQVYDAANGLVRYYLQGDEYAAVGDVLFQFTVYTTEWGGASVGRGFFRSSTPTMKRRVLATP